MGLALLTLLVASWVGLSRIGWIQLKSDPTLILAHGPLMVSGFLGTLIGVERAVALRKRWGYFGPIFTALGAIGFILGFPKPVPHVLLLLGSMFMVLVFGSVLRKHLAFYTVLMGAGSVSWVVGNAIWLFEGLVSSAVPWWAGFLILTIAGERLELGRIIRLSDRSRFAVNVAVSIFGVGLVITLIKFDWGMRILGVGMLAIGFWLLRFDIARRTIRKDDLPKFIAVCMLSGYLWLIFAGALGLFFGSLRSGLMYDAWLHTIFLGFVFAMIFGHAPVIFPAVLGFPISFKPYFYIHWFLLQISLSFRVVGDLLAFIPARKWGGMFNGIAILVFLITIVIAIGQRLVQQQPAGD